MAHAFSTIGGKPHEYQEAGLWLVQMTGQRMNQGLDCLKYIFLVGSALSSRHTTGVRTNCPVRA